MRRKSAEPESTEQAIIPGVKLFVKQGKTQLGSFTLAKDVSDALLRGEIVRFEMGGYQRTIAAFTHIHAKVGVA